jgi:ketosteroid isomerase-like protein
MRKSLRFAVCLLSLCLANILAGKAWADDFSEVAQLSREGKFVEALAKAEVYLSSRPKDAQMRLLKGLVQRDAGKPTDALMTFVRMTEDFPELPEPYNNLGVIYADQNQLDKARTAFEMALRTNPSYATAHENLADVYGRLSSAAYNKALQIDLSNAAVAPKLALVRQIITLNPTKLSAAQLAALPKVQAAPAPTAPATQVALAPAKPEAAKPEPASKPAPQPEPASKTSREPAPAARKPADEAAPAAQKNAPVVDTTANREVEQAVQNWAAAWGSKDLKSYFAAYGRDFDPAGKLSRSQWEEERRARIEGKANISVKLTDLQTLVRGNTALVKFRQDYRANGIAISSRKTLEMVRQGDNWKIVREAVGG